VFEHSKSSPRKQAPIGSPETCHTPQIGDYRSPGVALVGEAPGALDTPSAKSPATLPTNAAGASAPPLGNTHEIMAQPSYGDLSRRVVRYMLQAMARQLLLADSERSDYQGRGAGQFAERTVYCLRAVVVGRSGIDVLHFPETGGAGYRNLMTCASVWGCPVCSAKITERRRSEIGEAVAGSDLEPVLFSFTVQHNQGDDLAGVLAIVLDGYRRFFKGAVWRSLRDQFEIVGRIRSLEVTHGDHGWHPHVHALLLLTDGDQVAELEAISKERWSDIVCRIGGYASSFHGLDVQTADDAVSSYLAKLGLDEVELSGGWSLSHELVKSPAKLGRRGGRSMLQLLADFAAGDDRAGSLWLEYYWAFKGQKHLVWSRGLRDRLDLTDEETDEEVEAREDEVAVLLATLSRDQWRVVLGNDARAELLDVASTGDPDAVWQFLESIGVQREGVQ